MKLFLDTANIDEIREIHAWGVLAGVTTNPSLIAKEGKNFIEVVHEICELVQGPVSAEVVAQDAEGMIKEGRLLAKVHPHIVVKVPLSPAGLSRPRCSPTRAPKSTSRCFQASQALLAGLAGATYISPFVGRVDDISWSGNELIENIVDIYGQSESIKTQVLAASIRHPMHLMDAALAGADVATCPYKVLKAAIKHPLTDSGNERFLKDWSTVPTATSVVWWSASSLSRARRPSQPLNPSGPTGRLCLNHATTPPTNGSASRTPRWRCSQKKGFIRRGSATSPKRQASPTGPSTCTSRTKKICCCRSSKRRWTTCWRGSAKPSRRSMIPSRRFDGSHDSIFAKSKTTARPLRCCRCRVAPLHNSHEYRRPHPQSRHRLRIRVVREPAPPSQVRCHPRSSPTHTENRNATVFMGGSYHRGGIRADQTDSDRVHAGFCYTALALT